MESVKVLFPHLSRCYNFSFYNYIIFLTIVFICSCNQRVEDGVKTGAEVAGRVDENEVENMKDILAELLFEKEFYDNQKKEIKRAIEIIDLNIKSNSPSSYYLEFKLKVKGNKTIKSLSLEYYDSEVGRISKHFNVHFIPNRIYYLKLEDPLIPSVLAYSQKIEKEKRSIDQNKLRSDERRLNSETPIVSHYFGPTTKIGKIIFDDDSFFEDVKDSDYHSLFFSINGIKGTIEELEKENTGRD